MLLSAYSNIGLIATEGVGQPIWVMIDKGFYDFCYIVGIIQNALMRNLKPVNILHDGRCLPCGHTVIHVEGQNQAKRMR